MTNNEKKPADSSLPATGTPTGQTIEELRKRYEALNEQRIKVEAQREGALARLKQIRQSAVEQFGTDDLDQLRARLAELTSQNEKMRADYQRSLDDIETRLDEIENDPDAEADVEQTDS